MSFNACPILRGVFFLSIHIRQIQIRGIFAKILQNKRCNPTNILEIEVCYNLENFDKVPNKNVSGKTAEEKAEKVKFAERTTKPSDGLLVEQLRDVNDIMEVTENLYKTADKNESNTKE